MEAASRTLGRGELAPENVATEDGQLHLTLPANTVDNAETEPKDFHGPGFYTTRIKVSDASSSNTDFFLYEPPDLKSEIDAEIYNAPPRRCCSLPTEAADKPIPRPRFVPYRRLPQLCFFYDQNSVTFCVDGESTKEYEDGLPDKHISSMSVHFLLGTF